MNHIKYRERTQEDNLNSILNNKIKHVKENNTITIPEPIKEPLVYWARKDVIKTNNLEQDKLIIECLKWPLSTDLLCYNCCHKFDGVPVPIPTILDKKRNKGNRNMNIALLSRQMWSNYKDENNNKRTVYSIPITPAGRRSELKVFGGNKTIEEYRKGFFGIIPPEDALECKPFLTIKNKLSLPFVDRNASTETVESSSVVNDNSSFSFTKKIQTSAVHQQANKFCERLNKAKNEKVLIKRERKEDNSNNLLSSMGVVIKRKK